MSKSNSHKEILELQKLKALAKSAKTLCRFFQLRNTPYAQEEINFAEAYAEYEKLANPKD
jgi:hypothetical protein